MIISGIFWISSPSDFLLSIVLKNSRSIDGDENEMELVGLFSCSVFWSSSSVDFILSIVSKNSRSIDGEGEEMVLIGLFS